MTPLNHALSLARRGLSVIPVPAPRPGVSEGTAGDGKVPTIAWKAYQTQLASLPSRVSMRARLRGGRSASTNGSPRSTWMTRRWLLPSSSAPTQRIPTRRPRLLPHAFAGEAVTPLSPRAACLSRAVSKMSPKLRSIPADSRKLQTTPRGRDQVEREAVSARSRAPSPT
jgi:hypothetical protein